MILANLRRKPNSWQVDPDQHFPLRWLNWACQQKTVVSLKWRRLSSANFWRACFDLNILITNCKINFSRFFFLTKRCYKFDVRHFLWNQTWFHIFWTICVGFLWIGFTEQKNCLLAKNQHTRGFISLWYQPRNLVGEVPHDKKITLTEE